MRGEEGSSAEGKAAEALNLNSNFSLHLYPLSLSIHSSDGERWGQLADNSEAKVGIPE